MKKKIGKAVVAGGLSLMLAVGGVTASAMSVPQNFVMGGGGPRQPQGQITLREPGEYTLRGGMMGTVRVDPGQGDVKLILDGVNLDGRNGPAIEAVSGDRLTIEQAPGSQNQIRGGFEIRDQEIEFQSELPDRQPVAPGNEQDGFQPGGQQTQQPTLPDNGQFGGQQGGKEQPDFQLGQQAQNQQNGQQPMMPGGQQGPSEQGDLQPGQFDGQQGNPFGGMENGSQQSTVDSALEIVEGVTENSAMALEADAENATTVTLTEENGTVKISESGTYIVTGAASNGGITVKKGTTGVVLILEDLDLTSTSGAALSINKNAEVQVIVSGNVTLTDNENPEDENSEDADVADAYDGAAIKIKAESVVFLTGDGTLTINGNAKNGIKAGDDSSLIIGGDVTLNINAVNDGINGNYDVTILSGDVTISAGDDGIHADHILTVGQDGEGPDLTITESNEGLEGTVVNIAGGKVSVTASDDGINAANGDGAYEGELGYSVNITGGDVTVKAGTDGIDSNGNVNLVGGSASIRSANNGGDAGIDYDGDYYVSGSFQLNNQSGVAGPDQMPGQMGGMPGQMGGQQFGGQQQMNGAPGNQQNGNQQGGTTPGNMGNQNNSGFGGMNGGRFGR